MTHDEAMAPNVIQSFPPSDGREWDCQCARCGSSVCYWDCDSCGGDGYGYHDCGDDTCCCLHPEDNIVCGICDGHGGWYLCVSDSSYCETHPLRGRENVQRGGIEWFVTEERARRLVEGEGQP